MARARADAGIPGAKTARLCDVMLATALITSHAVARKERDEGKTDARRAAAQAEIAHLAEYVDLIGFEHFEPVFFACQDCACACGSLEFYMFRL